MTARFALLMDEANISEDRPLGDRRDKRDYSSSCKASGVIPACRRIARNVPRSNSAWSGTDRVVGGFSRNNIMWLPR